jgi:hypothetical protein
VRESWETGARRGFEQKLDAVTIGDVRPVDLGREYQTLGVHQQMTFSALDLLLGPVLTALRATYSGRLDRLGVHNSGTRLRVPFQANPHMLAQC